MNFKENNAIYLQIADRICDEIVLHQHAEEERIPSVRDYAAMVEVNANTAMRAFDYLQSKDIIYNKRGIGYFVSKGAKKAILKMRRESFMKEDLEWFFRQIYTLEISIDEIEKMYNEFSNKQNSIKG